MNKARNPSYDSDGSLKAGYTASSVKLYEGFEIWYLAGGNLDFTACALAFRDSVEVCWKIHCDGCVSEEESQGYWSEESSSWVPYDSKFFSPPKPVCFSAKRVLFGLAASRDCRREHCVLNGLTPRISMTHFFCERTTEGLRATKL